MSERTGGRPRGRGRPASRPAGRIELERVAADERRKRRGELSARAHTQRECERLLGAGLGVRRPSVFVPYFILTGDCTLSFGWESVRGSRRRLANTLNQLTKLANCGDPDRRLAPVREPELI